MSKAKTPQAGPGHNSADTSGLKSIVDRIEAMAAERDAIASDIRDIYTEAKGRGFDVRALRGVIRERKLSADERAEREMMLDTYRHALGMLADLPLGQSALERA